MSVAGNLSNFNSIFTEEVGKRSQFYQDLKFYPNTREASGCLVDIGSILRNTTSSIGAALAVPAVAMAVGASAIAGGALGIGVGGFITRDAYKRMKATVIHRDPESFLHHGLNGLGGISYAALSTLAIPIGIMDLARITVPASLTAVSAGFGLGMYGLIGLQGAHGYQVTRNFEKKFAEQREAKTDREILKWLHEQITLSPEELGACGHDEKKIRRLLQKKWNKLDLQIGSRCSEILRQKLPGLLENFDPKKARELIEEVEKSNYKEKVKYVLFMLIALIGIASFLTLLLISGPASPVLMAIAALAWLTVDSSKIHSLVGDFFWNSHKNQSKSWLELKE